MSATSWHIEDTNEHGDQYIGPDYNYEAIVTRWPEETKAQTIERAQRIIRAVNSHDALKEMEQDYGNLLARIHGDGGHYFVKHGSRKAGEDAEAIVIQSRVITDALVEAVLRIARILNDWPESTGGILDNLAAEAGEALRLAGVIE